jgi:hypothetical protein
VIDTIRAWATVGQRPNFINVDFYQGTFGARSYLLPLVNAMNSASFPLDLTNLVFPIHIQDTNQEDWNYNSSQQDNPQNEANMLLAGTQNYIIMNVGTGTFLNIYLTGDGMNLGYLLPNDPAVTWGISADPGQYDYTQPLTGHIISIHADSDVNANILQGVYWLVWTPDSHGMPSPNVTVNPNYGNYSMPQLCWEIRYIRGIDWIIRVSSVVIDGEEQQDGNKWCLTASGAQPNDPDVSELILADRDDGNPHQHWIFSLSGPTGSVFQPAPVQPIVPTPSSS